MVPFFTVPSLAGKTALVTGGASGIGEHTTMLLASAGCTVYIASRNAPSPIPTNCHHHALDLSTTSAAAASAASFLATHPSITLDILIANAGIALDVTATLSNEGWERHWQTNYLGHFAFILGILPAMKRGIGGADKGRLVIVSSEAHKFAPPLTQEYIVAMPPLPGLGGAMKRYGASKMAGLLFAAELTRRAEGEGLAVSAVHPGTAIGTNLGDATGTALGVPRVLVSALRRLGGVVGFSNRDAALTQVWIATAPEEVVAQRGWGKGEYLVPDQTWMGTWRGVKSEIAAGEGTSAERAKEVWAWGEEACRKSGAWPAAAK